jgi:DNA repair protein RadC
MMKPKVRDCAGFYSLPTDLYALISLLLPRISAEKLDKLKVVLADRPAKSLKIEHLLFLTEREATVILAAIALGRIAWSRPTALGALIDSPEASYQVFSEILRGKTSEYFVVLFLDVRNRLIGKEIVSIGSWTETLVPVAEILKMALLKNSPRIIVAHNHPSGFVEPSAEDLAVTEQLSQACKAVSIVMLDHVVVADHQFTSIRHLGTLPTEVWGD